MVVISPNSNNTNANFVNSRNSNNNNNNNNNNTNTNTNTNNNTNNGNIGVVCGSAYPGINSRTSATHTQAATTAASPLRKRADVVEYAEIRKPDRRTDNNSGVNTTNNNNGVVASHAGGPGVVNAVGAPLSSVEIDALYAKPKKKPRASVAPIPRGSSFNEREVT